MVTADQFLPEDGGWRLFSRKGHRKTCWGAGNSLYLCCGDSYIGAYACESSWQCTVKWMPFIICKL